MTLHTQARAARAKSEQDCSQGGVCDEGMVGAVTREGGQGSSKGQISPCREKKRSSEREVEMFQMTTGVHPSLAGSLGER